MADLDLTLTFRGDTAFLRQARADIERLGATGAAGNQQIERTANRANRSIRDMGRAGEFALGALGAFLFYRGFVFLSNQAQLFISSLVDLEKEVAIVQTQLDDLGRDFQPLIRDRVIKTAQEAGLAFDAVAKAQFEVVSANIDLADSFEILDLAAKAAVAGGLQDVELAFNAALSQVNAFNLSNEEFADVFDKQFNLVKRGIFTYEQFATVVGSVSEAFASMGQDIETANAALAAISQVFTGKQLERGATGLRNAVLRISEAREDFEELGVAVTDARGEFRSFIDIGRDINTVLDGLSGSARAETIKRLFPDERERRGINAFLGQLDQAQQFFVEQQFAAGDLEEAFQTVNDVLSQQATILRNDLTPALEPVVDLFGSLASGVNELNDLMPGFTRNVVTLGAALTALRLGRGVLATPFAGPGFGPVRGMKALPTGLGIGAGVAGAGLGFAAGRRPGFEGADLAGSILGGAAFGSLFGPAGIAAGAAAGGIAFAIGQAFEREAPPIAESFADRFASELAARGGDVASAFAASIATASSTPLAAKELRIAALAPGRAPTREQARAQLLRDFPNLSRDQLEDTIQTQTGRIGRGDIVAFFEEVENNREALSSFADEQRRATALTIANQEDLEQVLSGATPELRQAVLNIVDDFLDAGKSIEDFEVALAEFAESGDILDLFKNAGQLITDTFSVVSAEFNSLIEGDFASLVPVFERMGDEGEALAATFSRISQTVQAFELLEKFQAFEFLQPDRQVQGEIRDLERSLKGTPQFVRDAFEPQLEALRARASKQTNLLESLGIDSTEAAKLLTEGLLGELGLVGGTFTTQDFVDALLAEAEGTPVVDKIVEEVIPGATFLADSLFEAGELVRTGLLDGLGFAADELQLMGEELQEFNRLAAQRRILEELGAIAEFAGVDATSSIQVAFRSLAEDMRLAGRSFFDLLSDPVKLSELLANMEFGDINVDQSTDNNFTVRISGDVSPSQLRILEDTIVNSLNRANRERRSR